ncbi:TRAP transporter substrate-binding protein [Microvirga aerophila]|uniref:ABC transporter substrate-binding protein n=1 Tax=Microvirga aerophila TaxID=670291 RepID=A0A512BZY8_9HYPH|nr:TRAP transporter substrate-binding protein [Microvirga aerophila]GEO17513.1 ABC transporter substrate-binding protein [Microvirga aerophila]
MKYASVLVAAVAAVTSLVSTALANAQDIQERTIRWGHLNDPGNPISQGVAKFAEIVAAKSGDKLKIREFPSSQLGNEMQQQAALRGGTQEMFTGAPTSLVGTVKDFGLLDLPFTFSSGEQARALVDGPFGKLLFSKLPEKGLVGLAYWDLGFRNVTNSKHPIAKVDDFGGLKLRVIANPVYIDTFKALGANPVPMNFAEVYTALEQKAVDGQENPFAIVLSAKLFEVQKYLSITNHTYTTNIVLMSKKFWDKLSPTEQKILQQAAAESLEYQRQFSRSYSEKALEQLKTNGMQVNEVSQPERERMQKETRSVTEKILAQYDPELVKSFQNELEQFGK